VYDRLKKATGQVFAPDDHARWQRWWEDVKRGEKAPDPAK
jgi:hypothetical protein